MRYDCQRKRNNGDCPGPITIPAWRPKGRPGLDALIEGWVLDRLTDIEGLRRDVADASSLIRQATAEELDELVAEGIIAGGMIPKVDSCTHAVRNGVHRAHILDGRIAHVLLLEIFTDAGIGTMVMHHRHDQSTDEPPEGAPE